MLNKYYYIIKNKNYNIFVNKLVKIKYYYYLLNKKLLDYKNYNKHFKYLK